MIYPKINKKNIKISVIAPSSNCGDSVYSKIRNDSAISKFNKLGHTIDFTKNAYGTTYKFASANELERAVEFMEAYKSNSDLILALRGGELQMEILPYIDFKDILNYKPKWYQGFSDNTVLTYTLTTICDIATIYGTNFGDFGMKPWHKYIKQNYNFWFGKNEVLKSTSKHEPAFLEKKEGHECDGYKCKIKTKYQIITGEKEVKIKGRLIGGCLDILRELCGSKYDNTSNFLEKYKNDGFLWYLESCDLKDWDTIRCLWKLKDNGWFKYVKGFLIGRPALENDFKDINAIDCYLHILKDFNVPIIYNMDFGHVKPNFYIVNGAIGELNVKNGKGEIKYFLQ